MPEHKKVKSESDTENKTEDNSAKDKKHESPSERVGTKIEKTESTKGKSDPESDKKSNDFVYETDKKSNTTIKGKDVSCAVKKRKAASAPENLNDTTKRKAVMQFANKPDKSPEKKAQYEPDKPLKMSQSSEYQSEKNVESNTEDLNPAQPLEVEIFIGAKPRKVTIDKNISKNLISQSLVDSLKSLGKLRAVRNTVRLPSGTSSESNATFTTGTMLGMNCQLIEYAVLSELPGDVLLGLEFVSKMNVDVEKVSNLQPIYLTESEIAQNEELANVIKSMRIPDLAKRHDRKRCVKEINGQKYKILVLHDGRVTCSRLP